MVAIVTHDDEARFTTALRLMADTVQKEVRYNPQRFRQMLAEFGGFGTARKLLDKREVSDGFAEIMSHGKHKTTMEYLVQSEEWRRFFTKEQLDWANKLTGGH